MVGRLRGRLRLPDPVRSRVSVIVGAVPRTDAGRPTCYRARRAYVVGSPPVFLVGRLRGRLRLPDPVRSRVSVIVGAVPRTDAGRPTCFRLVMRSPVLASDFRLTTSDFSSPDLLPPHGPVAFPTHWRPGAPAPRCGRVVWLPTSDACSTYHLPPTTYHLPHLTSPTPTPPDTPQPPNHKLVIRIR
jgi:hypothetical protein